MKKTLLAILAAATMFGCGAKKAEDESTVNVRVTEGGFLEYEAAEDDWQTIGNFETIKTMAEKDLLHDNEINVRVSSVGTLQYMAPDGVWTEVGDFSVIKEMAEKDQLHLAT
ncbi:MAG: hypothetical protein IJL95_08140, partial [Solobacterium sp.]|nr:hypothetical protein [Solobacterium sp.]